MTNPDRQYSNMFVLGVDYCVQLLPEVIFFSNIPFTFSFAKAFFFYVLSFFHLKFSEMPNFAKYMMPY